jgi:predicted metalloprotease with PDZ domain
VIARAGILTPADYARRLSGAVNTLTNSPARAFTGAVGMSQQAPFVDAAVSIDPTNRSNTFISYYTYGEALGIALDLTLRARTPRVTLDDYMRALWQEFGRPQTAALAPVRGYTLADAERVLSTVSGDPAFAREFFARYVIGSELPDFPVLLARAGVVSHQGIEIGRWREVWSGLGLVIVTNDAEAEQHRRAKGVVADDAVVEEAALALEFARGVVGGLIEDSVHNAAEQAPAGEKDLPFSDVRPAAAKPNCAHRPSRGELLDTVAGDGRPGLIATVTPAAA